MRRLMLFTSLFGLCLCLYADQACAMAPETELLLQLLEAKGVITAEDAANFKDELATMTEAAAENKDAEHFHSVQSLDTRLQKLEQAQSEKDELASMAESTVENKDAEHFHSVQSLDIRLQKLEQAQSEKETGLPGNLQFSGYAEFEANYSKIDANSGPNEESSEVHLAEAEIDMDAAVNEYVSSHLAFLWEDNNNGQDTKVDLDVGVITIDGGEKFPLVLSGGKMVIPFGRYESHFITDPTTLTLGETNEGAVMVGYSNDFFQGNLGFFNGDVNPQGDASNDHINNVFTSTVFYFPVEAAAVETGISYTSNLASSKTLSDLSTTGEISHLVGAVSAFANISLLERYRIIGEYMTAIEDYATGDFTFNTAAAYPDDLHPRAWNFEISAFLVTSLEAALRYGGSNQFGNEALEEMYGAALLYNIFNHTTLTLEYLTGEYQSKDDLQSATMQVAVEF